MQLFLSKTGSDMENIDKELEKLICYTLDKTEIAAADVEAICTGQTENKIFEMIDAISAKNQKKALDLYYDLLASTHADFIPDCKTVPESAFDKKHVSKRISCCQYCKDCRDAKLCSAEESSAGRSF